MMENYEQQGDNLCEDAIQADDEKRSQELWQAAADKYSIALGCFSNYRSIEGIRLHRKLASCHRKLGNDKVAIKLYLKPTTALIRKCVSTSDLHLEEAYIQLEYAYHALNKNSKSSWCKVQDLAEGIIEAYCHDEQLIGTGREILYILGEAYNLLGIVLQGNKGITSGFEESAEDCWNIAIEKLKRVKDPISKHAILNIMLNRALVELDQGNCDKTIQILEGILYSADAEHKLSIQQRLGVQYNLAAAYIDRLTDKDLSQARELAHKNLNIARKYNNFNELVKTVELYGNIIKEEIKAVIKGGQLKQVAQLVIEYENYFHEITESSTFYKDWDNECDLLVIRRLLVEIYLLNKDTEKAKVELQHVEAMELSNTQQDQEELFLTRAVFEQSRHDHQSALSNLKAAKGLFSKAKRLGMVIEVNIRCAELSVSQSKWSEAEQYLVEALNLAKNRRLACQNRIVRIENMLKYVNEKPKKRIVRIFYCYAHEDEKLREKLETHLKLLERQGQIEQWHDRRIIAGDDWKGQINRNLECADIILLLISPDFLASDYCYDIEMKRAIERHNSRSARVIPVIIRDVNWDAAPFGHLQSLPKNGKAVTTWSNRDSAWRNVAHGIEKAIKAISIPGNK